MKYRNSQNSGFVADGCDRAWKAMKPRVQREVEAEFAEEWNASGWIRRWSLRHLIEAEVRRRLCELAPPDALY